ncbi:DUF547 domain-containing protein [Fundidesulfovibrio terrae]|uniref:DUF547 domain-containing protein n=1 Tax=Fundidesulfovibrio terrae TaxID=2922866 RepID=UPI001FAF1931|nr:DUF547 domain-containing protein [Fundidesulfovibrio terrae]
MRTLSVVFFMILIQSMVLCLCWAGPVDNQGYAALLRSYVKDGVVDYAGLKRKESDLDAYLVTLEQISPGTMSRNDQLAFYINAYNAWTLKLVLMNYPVKSIRDIGGIFSDPWKIQFVKIDGKTTTLNYIEHNVLRPRFKDPRVHMAINCASKSCPPLMSIPFEGDKLESQLDQVTGAFVNDMKSNRIEGRTLYVSSIFDWFGEDFGGKSGVISFFIRYLKPEYKARLEAGRGDVQLGYLKYDWSLNGN